MDKIIVDGEIEGVPLKLETGYLAPQAEMAVKVSFGETVVLTLVTVGEPMETPTFLPLTIEYLEKLYAGGVISGSRFVKREMRPSDGEILKARLIDHAVRSLFKEDFYNNVQVVNLVMSYDMKNDPGVAATIGTSAALCAAGLPVKGPIGTVKIGYEDDKVTYNLSDEKDEETPIMMHVFATNDGITSLESEGNQTSEEDYIKLMEEGFERCQSQIELQKEFIKKVGNKTYNYVPLTNIPELAKDLYSKVKDEIIKDVFGNEKVEMYQNLKQIKDKVAAENEDLNPGLVSEAVNKVVKKLARESILAGKRPDGRKDNEIRPISAEVGVLPRTHGSAIFNRGLTQVLSAVTLGSTRLEQMMEGIGGEDTKRFMHHYNMKGYATGEVDPRLYYPGRREIGHGAIGEKALRQMIPEEEKFPYAIRSVSEVLSSNGSTSMAATCGTSMALMDAGVPIESPVAGISMGLVYEEEGKYKLLTDIQGLEDGAGDMDFKVAGTKKGINAVQLDNKMGGVPIEVLKDGIAQAREVRLGIMEKMGEAISTSRIEMSKYAPKIETLKIDQDRIGELIGPGGKVIRGITEETGAEIDISEEGLVSIAAIDAEAREKALEMVHDVIDEAEIGEEYEGEVDRIENYGVFVKISSAITGLLHVSEISDAFISDVSKVFDLGDKVKVKVNDIDDMGKVSVTMKGVEGNEEIQKKVKQVSGDRGGRGGDRGRRSDNRSGDGKNHRYDRNNRRSPRR